MDIGTFTFRTNMEQMLREVDAGLAKLNAKLAGYKSPAAGQLSSGITQAVSTTRAGLPGIEAQVAARAAQGGKFDPAKFFRDYYNTSVAEIDRQMAQFLPGLNANARPGVERAVADLKRNLALDFERYFSTLALANQGLLPSSPGVFNQKQATALGLTPQAVADARLEPHRQKAELERGKQAVVEADRDAAAKTKQSAAQASKVAQAEREFAAALEVARSQVTKAYARFANEARVGISPPSPVKFTDGRLSFSDIDGSPVATVRAGGKEVTTTNPALVEEARRLDAAKTRLVEATNEQRVEAQSQARVNKAVTAQAKQVERLTKEQIDAKKKIVAYERLIAAGATQVGTSRFLQLNGRGFQIVPVQQGSTSAVGAVPVAARNTAGGPGTPTQIQYNNAVAQATRAQAAQTTAVVASTQAMRAQATAATQAAGAQQYSRLQQFAGTVVGGPAGLSGVGRGLGVQDLLHTGLSFTRYLASAAVIGGGIAGIAQAKQEILDYKDSVTDLEHAMREIEGPSRQFLDSLTELSAQSGAQPGEAIDAAARAVRAFNLETEDAEGRVQSFVQTLSELSLITGKTIPNLAGDQIATMTSFGIDPSGSRRVADAIVAARNAFGGDGGQISQGLALISATANEAGFELEEMANIIGLIQARTDQSGQAITTRLSRIISMISGSSGKTFLAQLNSTLGQGQQIDLSASVADQLRQIQDVFPDLSENTQQRLINRLGGTSALKELIPLLTEGSALSEALASSLSNSGESAEEFSRRANDLRGQLRQIGGSIREIVIEVAESGFLDAIGAAIYALNPALDVVSELLKAYNELPRVLRTIIALTLQAAAAAKIYGAFASQAGGGFAAAAGAGAGAQATAAALNLTNTARTNMGLRVAGAAGGTVLGWAKAALFNPISIAAMLTYSSLSALAGAVDRTTQAIQTAGSDLKLGGIPQTSADVRDRIASLESVAANVRGSSSGVLGTFTNFLAGNRTGDLAAFLEAEAKALNERQDILDELAREAASGPADTARITTGSVDSIRSSVEALRNTGASADTILAALRGTLDDLATSANDARGALTPWMRERAGAQFGIDAPGIVAALTAEIAGMTRGGRGRGGMYFDPALGISGDIERFLGIGRGRMEADEVANRVAQAFGSESAFADILPQVVNEVLEKFAAGEELNLREELNRAFDSVPADALEGIPDAVQQVLRQDLTARLIEILESMGVELGDVLTSFSEGLPGLIARFVNAGALVLGGVQLNAGLLGTVRSVADSVIGDVMDAFSWLSGGSDDEKKPTMTLEEAQATFDEVREEAERKARNIRLQGIIAGNAEQAAVNAARFVLNELRGAFKSLLDQGFKADELNPEREVILQAEADEVQAQESYSNFLQGEADRRAREAEEARRRAQELRRARTLAGVDPRDGVGQAAAELSLARAELAETAAGTAEYYDALRAVNEAQIELSRAHANQVLAFQRLALVDPESQLQQAEHAIRVAIDAVNQALPGTQEYADAQYQLREAQIQLSDAQLEAASIARQLGQDLTDPVVRAREELRVAEAQLRADQRRGAPQDVINQGRLEVINAQNSLEAAQFSQRLSDAQTANQLGEMSHKAYIDYLEAERERLLSIQDRTRQQTEWLLQIEQAIQAANNQLQGQFNLGDIRVPTPFEVRRAMAGQFPGDGASAGVRYGTVINNQVQIDGTDFARVVDYLEQILGRKSISRTGGTAQRKF